jgi:hypothetical protein
MMARYCARWAVFFNTEFGSGRKDLTMSAWLVAADVVVGIFNVMDDIQDQGANIHVRNFENLLMTQCSEFMDFVKMALEKRVPEKALCKTKNNIKYVTARMHNGSYVFKGRNYVQSTNTM